MNHHMLTELGRQRRQVLRAEFARSSRSAPLMRALVARALRASGDRLFRLGVALDERVSPAVAMDTPTI